MKKEIISKITFGLMAILSLLPRADVFADNELYGIDMSPMNESIVLNAGEKYNGSFKIRNLNTKDMNFPFSVVVSPFYVNEDYNVYYDESSTFNEIVNWTETDITEGTLAPNESMVINFEINVPDNAPAGGQYVAILVNSRVPNTKDDFGEGVGMQINQSISMSHIIYAEIAGTTKRGGEITNIVLPSFLFTDNIKASSMVRNTGNVHAKATYKMQIFPLFSNEEIYTNEENPQTKTILPDRTLYNETIWENTPAVGIFNVVYTVEFEGVTEQVSKMVIKCPIWLLFIIIFAIVVLIIYIVLRAKNKGKKASR